MNGGHRTGLRTRSKKATSATTYHGRDEEGRELFPPIGVGQSTPPEGARGIALLRTQKCAEKDAQEPSAFVVQRRTLFGPATDLYRVVRHEGGAVSTVTLSTED